MHRYFASVLLACFLAMPALDASGQTPEKSFGIGSSQADVERIQGEPSVRDGNAWYYGFNIVYFADGRVTRLVCGGLTRLRTADCATPPVNGASQSKPGWGAGFSKADVGAIQDKKQQAAPARAAADSNARTKTNWRAVIAGALKAFADGNAGATGAAGGGETAGTVPKYYWGGTGGEWLNSVTTDGSVVVLSDNSVWEVHSLDRIRSAIWVPYSHVTIVESRDVLYPHILVHDNLRQTVRARLLR